MKIFLWTIFIVIAAAMSVQLQALKPSGYRICDLELAHTNKGIDILKKWQTSYSGDRTLLEISRNNTKWDFLFIAVYATLLIVMSNWQMQRENWLPLNEALRLNFLLAFIAGVFDIFENFGMLHNFHHTNDIANYWSTHWLAMIKFGLLALALLIFAISFLKSVVQRLNL